MSANKGTTYGTSAGTGMEVVPLVPAIFLENNGFFEQMGTRPQLFLNSTKT